MSHLLSTKAKYCKNLVMMPKLFISQKVSTHKYLSLINAYLYNLFSY